MPRGQTANTARDLRYWSAKAARQPSLPNQKLDWRRCSSGYANHQEALWIDPGLPHRRDG